MEQLGFEGMPRRLYACTPTRLSVWLDCPRRYRMTYLDRPARPSSAAACPLPLVTWPFEPATRPFAVATWLADATRPFAAGTWLADATRPFAAATWLADATRPFAAATWLAEGTGLPLAARVTGSTPCTYLPPRSSEASAAIRQAAIAK